MNKCKYCLQKATRLHARHDTGELENLCEYHYSKWEPELADWTKINKEVIK